MEGCAAVCGACFFCELRTAGEIKSSLHGRFP